MCTYIIINTRKYVLFCIFQTNIKVLFYFVQKITFLKAKKKPNIKTRSTYISTIDREMKFTFFQSINKLFLLFFPGSEQKFSTRGLTLIKTIIGKYFYFFFKFLQLFLITCGKPKQNFIYLYNFFNFKFRQSS